MDGYIQTGLGILFSLILFVIGYRQTIGAKKERAKNANSSITRAIMRRMVLEDYSPVYKDITRVIEGKAREFKVSIGDLLAEEQVLNSLFTEVFDSDLISPSQRIEIENRINTVLSETEKEPVKATISDLRQYKAEKDSKRENLTAMVISASLLGTLSTFMYSFYQTKTFETDFLLSALSVLIGSVAIITALTTYRKSKEVETVSSRSSAAILASRFESEIAKVLTKNKFQFAIEPQLGKLRPDFMVNLEGKRIVVEGKSWGGAVPLSTLRRTGDYLKRLVALEEVDEAILVTQKNDNVPPYIFEDERVSVVSISELANKLKNAA